MLERLIMRRSTLFVVAGFLPAMLNCQPQSNRISFEVASVKVVPITEPSIEEETPKRVWFRMILPALVMRAYEIKPYQLQNSQLLKSSPFPRYDIQATLPAGGAKKSDIPAMLRSLLEDRFRFSAHWEEKPTQVYKLEVDSGGLKLNRLELGEIPPDRPLQIGAPRQGLVKFRGAATLQQLAEFLSPAMDHPVLDATAAPGVFRISLDARVPSQDIDISGLPLFHGKNVDGPDDSATPADIHVNGATVYGDAPDIGAALKKMGLRLEKTRDNIRVLVVGSVNKTPTAN